MCACVFYLAVGSSRLLVCKCASEKFSGSFERDPGQEYGLDSNQVLMFLLYSSVEN